MTQIDNWQFLANLVSYCNNSLGNMQSVLYNTLIKFVIAVSFDEYECVAKVLIKIKSISFIMKSEFNAFFYVFSSMCKSKYSVCRNINEFRHAEIKWCTWAFEYKMYTLPQEVNCFSNLKFCPFAVPNV